MTEFADLSFFEELAEDLVDHEIVEVEAWGRKVRINRLPAEEVFECTRAGKPIDVSRALLAKCLSLEDGTPIFNGNGEGLIEKWDPGIQIALGNKALELNGLRADVGLKIEDAKKN